eukprot:TRINITY_DN49098_c0_g1_i1.p1 TRINITY_DN49098_c0_g1~~TRINITY_DN49098_c0_g1_i1.p1  ORF type:complete len:393 (+),score=82.19 TRINITY_DN49098_c0_g1_i1:64-1242(+)
MLIRIVVTVCMVGVFAGIAAFIVYCYWNKIKEVFGIGVSPTDVEAGARLDKASAVGQPQQTERTSRSSGGSASSAPMIVVSSDDTNRGELMTYEVLCRACANWAESRVLGKGAAAVVYSGDLPRFGQVAVKRFHRDPSGGMAWNFDRELEALSQCRHPHVLEILGRAQTGPEQLIVMPLMEGGTLASAWPRMSWAPRAVCLGQIVRAVSFLHGKKMVHRDIKSSNILMDRALRHARLADFGLAKDQIKGSRTHGTTGIVVGSPGYMAPELMMRPANDKTDSYALGVVMLEALTGLAAWDEDREIIGLTDAAVNSGAFEAHLVDKAARWPAEEIEVLGEQAAKMTSFDPSARLAVTVMEEGAAYRDHLERADQVIKQTDGSGAAQTIGASAVF